MIRRKNIFKKPIFVAALIFFGVWLALFRMEIITNLELLFANWLTIVLGTVAVAIVVFIFIKLEITTKKKKSVPVIV